MLRYLTAGESHGQALVVIVEGLPAGLSITVEDIHLLYPPICYDLTANVQHLLEVAN